MKTIMKIICQASLKYNSLYHDYNSKTIATTPQLNPRLSLGLFSLLWNISGKTLFETMPSVVTKNINTQLQLLTPWPKTWPLTLFLAKIWPSVNCKTIIFNCALYNSLALDWRLNAWTFLHLDSTICPIERWPSPFSCLL